MVRLRDPRRASGLLLIAVMMALAGCGGGKPGEPAATATPLAVGTPDARLAAQVQIVPVVRSFLAGLPANWGQVSPQDAAARKPFIVDVREPVEYEKGTIQGAANVPLRDLARSLTALPSPDREVALVCDDGARAAIGMTVLRMLGYNAESLTGGLQAWQAAGLPMGGGQVEKPAGGPIANVDPALQAALDVYLRETIRDDWGFYDAAALSEVLKRDLPATESTKFVRQLKERYYAGPPLLLDVREPDEANAAPLSAIIPVTSTLAAPLPTLLDHLGEIPWDKPVVDACGIAVTLEMDASNAPIAIVSSDTHRAVVGMAVMQLIGYVDVHALRGGLGVWGK